MVHLYVVGERYRTVHIHCCPACQQFGNYLLFYSIKFKRKGANYIYEMTMLDVKMARPITKKWFVFGELDEKKVTENCHMLVECDNRGSIQ